MRIGDVRVTVSSSGGRQRVSLTSVDTEYKVVPVGVVVENPATGAAAAALGGYLRDASLIETPAEFEIRQGETMGRPSQLAVTVPPAGGIIVTGAAVAME